MNLIIQQIVLSEFDLSLSGMRIMNPERILRIEKSMSLHGQLQPVVARENNGNYQIIDGFKRFHAAADLMMESLQCRVLDIDLAQAKVLLLSYNRCNQSMDAWEEAMVLRDLLSAHSLSQSTLARMTGYSRSWVSRRLGLIEKLDQDISSDIMMGVLTSSHARALTRLPRGNQGEFARVITSYRLSSRQSEALAEAFLKAKSREQQRQILDCPEQILREDPPLGEYPYDARLSGFGNDLMQCSEDLTLQAMALLSKLNDRRTAELEETEKIIIVPSFKRLSSYAGNLAEALKACINKSESI